MLLRPAGAMLINGQNSDTVRADDRGLAYGDGLFETIRVCAGQPLFLQEHLERLADGARCLAIPCDLDRIGGWIRAALADSPSDGVLKLVLTRGSGGRGYRPPADPLCTCIISLHSLPTLTMEQGGAAAFLCQQRLGSQPALAGIKHLNRLEQVLASREIPETDCFEGLMGDYQGKLIEATRSNVFVALDGQWLTPRLTDCGIRGVLRRKLLERFGSTLREADIPLQRLPEAEEIFVGNSVFGVVPLATLRIGDDTLYFTCGPFAQAARAYFEEEVSRCS